MRVRTLEATVDQVGDVGVVGGRGERDEHALGVPILGIEVACLFELVLGAVGEALGLCLVGHKRRAVIDGFARQRDQMERAVAVMHDELCGVLLIAVHARLDERRVFQGEDVLAPECLQGKAQAVFLYGVERHGASLRVG